MIADRMLTAYSLLDRLWLLSLTGDLGFAACNISGGQKDDATTQPDGSRWLFEKDQVAGDRCQGQPNKLERLQLRDFGQTTSFGPTEMSKGPGAGQTNKTDQCRKVGPLPDKQSGNE